METFTSYRAHSGNRHQHLIYPDDPHPQSLAALVLIQRQYTLLDPEANPEINWKIYKRRRRQVLKEHFAKYGKYICAYCKRADLSPDFPPGDPLQVTIDHIIPVSRGRSYTSKKNMVVCCPKCNGDKGNSL